MTNLDEEESKDPLGKKQDISFNTLLDDSTLSFNPDAPNDTTNSAFLFDNSQKKQ